MAEKLAGIIKNNNTRKPIISGTKNAPLSSGWTTVESVNADSDKRYLVIYQGVFSDNTDTYKAVGFYDTYDWQNGVIATGVNISTTAVIEGKNSIVFKAYAGGGGTVTITYQIIEL